MLRADLCWLGQPSSRCVTLLQDGLAFARVSTTIKIFLAKKGYGSMATIKSTLTAFTACTWWSSKAMYQLNACKTVRISGPGLWNRPFFGLPRLKLAGSLSTLERRYELDPYRRHLRAALYPGSSIVNNRFWFYDPRQLL